MTTTPHVDTCDAWNNAGVTLYKLGRFEEARRDYLEKALAGYERALGTRAHPLVARTLKNLGNVHKKEVS